MASDPRVQQLLLEVLDSEITPEEACRERQLCEAQPGRLELLLHSPMAIAPPGGWVEDGVLATF